MKGDTINTRNNQLVAKFMGGHYDADQVWWVLPEESNMHLHYDEDWARLIPVVEKIESMFNNGISVIISSNQCHIELDTQTALAFNIESLPEDFYSGKCKSKIIAVHKSVVRFIKWHNVIEVKAAIKQATSK